MAMQRPTPFGSMTVLENVVLGAMFGVDHGVVGEREARRRAAEALAFVGLERAGRPAGLEPEPPSAAVSRAGEGARRPAPAAAARRGDGGPERVGARHLGRDRPERPRPARNVAILWVEHVMSAVIQLAERAIVLNFGKLHRRGRARGRDAGPAGRRRVPRAGARCLRSSGWRPGTSASGSSTASTSRFAPVRRWRSSARTARARRRSSGRSPGCSQPMEGRVLLDGKDLTRRPAHRISRAGIAYVPAERHLFPAMTLKSNLVLGAYPKRPDRATLELVYDLFPRLKERQRQQAGTLSGGEQQMLAVGRALMARPRLLMLDEPTTGLAPKIAQIAFEALDGLKKEGHDAADRGAAGAARAVRGRPRLRARERPHPAQRDVGRSSTRTRRSDARTWVSHERSSATRVGGGNHVSPACPLLLEGVGNLPVPHTPPRIGQRG